MKISTLALLISATMAMSITNYQIGKRGSMEWEKEIQFKKAMNPTPLTDIEEGIENSTISENWKVKDPEDSEVIFFPRDSPEAQESEEPKVSPETAESEDFDDSDLILIPREDSDEKKFKQPKILQASENHRNSPYTKTNSEIIEKLMASETELLSMAQKVHEEEKLDVSRYFALHSEIIELREALRSRPADMETRREMEGVINKVLNEYRNLNRIIGNLCNGDYDRYGYCSTFSADTFFKNARANLITFNFLLGEFEDDRYIKDPEYAKKYIPKLIFTYKRAVETFNELGKFGLDRWLNGDNHRAVAEYLAVKQYFEKVTTIMQQYNLV